jgi:glyoxylase-like metal-dependent hydrolase (beta-lactamase superfamily II)
MSSDQHQAAELNHEFAVGEFDCTVVSDGSFAYPNPRRLFFSNAEQDELATALERHGIDPESWETYVSPYPCLLIRTDDGTVLVDTGGGGLGDHTGRLLRNLKQVGTPPEAIDTVLLSHIHPDHVGGNLDENGDPAFPNAEYVVSQTEADFWLNDPDLSALHVPDHITEAMITFADQQVRLLRERRKLIDDGSELVAGVRTVPAPGHTPGHVAVEVASMDESLLYLVDLVFHPVHVEHPEWYTAFDVDPDTAVESRNRLLDQAADRAALVLAQHFPAPGLGWIHTTDTGYEWTPISDE